MVFAWLVGDETPAEPNEARDTKNKTAASAVVIAAAAAAAAAADAADAADAGVCSIPTKERTEGLRAFDCVSACFVPRTWS